MPPLWKMKTVPEWTSSWKHCQCRFRPCAPRADDSGRSARHCGPSSNGVPRFTAALTFRKSFGRQVKTEQLPSFSMVFIAFSSPLCQRLMMMRVRLWLNAHALQSHQAPFERPQRRHTGLRHHDDHVWPCCSTGLHSEENCEPRSASTKSKLFCATFTTRSKRSNGNGIPFFRTA